MTHIYEYQVQERGFYLDEWYRHGYVGFSIKKAKESYQHMYSTYSKYGRQFRLARRKIGNWEVVCD